MAATNAVQVFTDRPHDLKAVLATDCLADVSVRRLGHHSCITSSEEPPLSNFNSYWDIPSVLGLVAFQKEDVMSTIKAFIKRHPLLTYFALTFAISWDGILLVIGGPGESRAPGSKPRCCSRSWS